jgi:hypothetical protein
MLLPGEILMSASYVRKSAEAIVGSGNELSLNGGGSSRTNQRAERMSCSKCCREAITSPALSGTGKEKES